MGDFLIIFENIHTENEYRKQTKHDLSNLVCRPCDRCHRSYPYILLHIS